MSGYPRWIRRAPQTEADGLLRSLKGLGSLVAPPSVPLQAETVKVARRALPDEGQDLSGLREHFARISRVRGTGGEQDTRR